jgi:hypothetical protein
VLPTYRHTQFGWVVAAGTAVGMLLATGMLLWLSAATLEAAWWLVAALYAVLAAAFLLFATLTVEVTEREVRARFGVGLLGRTIPLADVLRSEIVRTRIWWGWGLHWTPGGWLYNVAGRQAVRLDLVRQRPVMIGSDDADGLKRAIDARIAGRAAA